MRLCALVSSALALAGCADAGPFMCDVAADCAGSAAGGACEASGYCSFPDDDCASGRRYGSHAPPELASICVPPDIADTGTTEPATMDDGGLDSQGDTTTSPSTSVSTNPLDDSSSEGVSSLTATSLDGSESGTSGDVVEDSSTGTAPFEIEYDAVIAVCTEDTVFDPVHCAVEAGVDQITIDSSDVDGLISNAWVRFDLDDTLAGAEVISAEVVFVVGPDDLDGSTNTGELWTTEPFDLAALSSANPAMIERIGDDLGAVRIGAEVSWDVPPELVIAGESLHLALVPVTSDGLDVWDANAATPPRLVITAQ